MNKIFNNNLKPLMINLLPSSSQRTNYRNLHLSKLVNNSIDVVGTDNTATSITSEPENDKKTSLYDFHIANNGKMVNFAGYLLPIQYGQIGIGASHLKTRKSASIFDVSHMLQTYLNGADVIECFESICTADIKNLPENCGTLTVFTNSSGGILDDLIVTKISSNQLYIVSNAGCRKQDMQIIESTVAKFRSNGKDCSLEFLQPNEQALIAVQGPEAVATINKLCDGNDNEKLFTNLYFMNTTVKTLAGISNCRITRCGYTGEDGVEISIPADKAVHVCEAILNENSNISMAGLGARDSLRLEAGLCLYGSDINETITPVEAGLSWLIGKRRRIEQNFPGADKILLQLKYGTNRKRIGVRILQGPPARHDIDIYLPSDKIVEKIGHITSGCPSPSLGGNVAMGYLQTDNSNLFKSGAKVNLLIRNKLIEAEISRMPFIKTNYYMTPKVIK